MMDYLNYFTNDCLKYAPRHKLSSKKILVIGCNDGRDCKFFLDAAEVHGIDICQEIGSSVIHDKIVYFRESAESMTRPDNDYDIVFSVATMEHIHNIELAFSEIVRVTKLGGLIYCVASPLWNSYDGHHQFGVFSDYPWIHLRLSKDEIVSYLQRHSKALNEAEGIVNFMFSDYFNFHPSTRYLKACEDLDVSYVIRNDLWHQGEQFLTDKILEELTIKGYEKDEILAIAHIYVAVK
jgi:SAM-dependent methyltransferase